MAERAKLAAVAGMAHRGATWLGLLCLLCCSAASALSPDVAIRDLRHTGWGPKEGAPAFMNALAQTRDGFLWMGGPSGLYQFDGLRFKHIDLPRDERLSSVAVYSLFAPSSGGLWIGFTFGGAAFLKDGKMTAYAERDGLPPGSVKAFAQDQDGTLWAGTTTGLSRLEGARWRAIGADDGYTDKQTEALLVDSSGMLWAASRQKVLYLPKGEKTFRDDITQYSSDDLPGLAESPSGAVWLSLYEGLRQLRKNENVGRRGASSGKSIVFDRDGTLWTNALEGDGALDRVNHPETLTAISRSQIQGWSVMYADKDGLTGVAGGAAMLQDREGNVWYASSAGLDRFSERNVTRELPATRVRGGGPTLATDGGAAFTPFYAALAPTGGGGLLIGGRQTAPFILRDGNVKPFDVVGFMSCAIAADDGSIWFGGSKGLSKYASGRFERIPLPEGTDDFEVQAMALDRSGALWLSIVRKGVFRLADGVWTANGGVASLPKLTAITLSTDAKGRVWFGYTEGRIAVLDGTNVTFFADQKRQSVGNVTALYGKRSTVWVGGELGLAVLDGSGFRTMIPEAAGIFTNITGIVETSNGDLWLNSSAGIVHVTAAETSRAAEDLSYRIHGEIFDALDGVQGNGARLRPLPTAIEDTDGRLWFLTNIALYSIDPARIHRNLLPPPVVIESLIADDKTYAQTADLKLPQRTTSVRIDYVGLSLTMAEKVRYRYKLDGVDKDWQDVQGRRQAFYTNLSPGQHRFHVIAANNDGVWNDTGATLDFVIPPTFVQTGWFIALCAVGGGMLVWMLIRIRVRQVAARMRGRLGERMAERERIARELHDTLLQSTQGLILRFQAVANRIPREDATREMLDKALDRADDVLAEGRDRVLDLRVPADTLNDLPKALAAAGEELAEGREVTFRTIVDGTPHDLVRGVKDEAYRIGREALINAFAHSEASVIEVQIIYADADLRVRVRDDGRGMDAGAIEMAPRPGHWGMKGMRERAEKMGAQLDIWSRHAAGTEIELRIPASVAYKDRGLLARWRRLARLG